MSRYTPPIDEFLKSSKIMTPYARMAERLQDPLHEQSYHNRLTIIVNRWREILEYQGFTPKEVDILIPNIGDKFIVRRNPKDPDSPGIFDLDKMDKFTNSVFMWLQHDTIVKQFWPRQM